MIGFVLESRIKTYQNSELSVQKPKPTKFNINIRNWKGKQPPPAVQDAYVNWLCMGH